MLKDWSKIDNLFCNDTSGNWVGVLGRKWHFSLAGVRHVRQIDLGTHEINHSFYHLKEKECIVGMLVSRDDRELYIMYRSDEDLETPIRVVSIGTQETIKEFGQTLSFP